MQSSGRGLHCIGIHRHTATCRDDNGIYRRTLASTGNGTKITHIGYTVEHHKDRVLTFLKEKRYKIFRLLVSNGGNKRYHSLMIFAGNAVDTFYRNTLYRDERTFQGACIASMTARTPKIISLLSIIYLFTI